jgi:hypothetical protein
MKFVRKKLAGPAALLLMAVFLLAAVPIGALSNEVSQQSNADKKWNPVDENDLVKYFGISESEMGSIPINEVVEASGQGSSLYDQTRNEPGYTLYGYNWLATQPNGAILQSIYECLVRNAEATSATTDTYENIDGSPWYGYGAVDFSSLGFNATVQNGVFYEEGSESMNSLNRIELVYATFLYDNPQYYFYTNMWAYLYDLESAKITGLVPLISYEYIEYNTRQAINARVESKFQEYVSLTSRVTVPYDIIRLVHDKMVAEWDYTYRYFEQGEVYEDLPYDAEYYIDPHPAAHNILGVLDRTTDGPVCEAYAEGFAYILNRLNVGNPIVVVGMAGNAYEPGGSLEPHMWNLVELGGYYYYIDITWDNMDHTMPGNEDYDFNNQVNSFDYTYFLVGAGNPDFRAGNNLYATHWPSGSTASADNPYVQYELPANISVADYTVPSSYKYLTDNGIDGRSTMGSTASTADDYPYVIAKSKILTDNFIGSIRNNPLFVRDIYDTYNWNVGPYYFGKLPVGATPAITLYEWNYDNTQWIIYNMFAENDANRTQLIQNTDFTVSVESGAPGDTVRVWLEGIGDRYRGIDFVLVTLTDQGATADDLSVNTAKRIIEGETYMATQATNTSVDEFKAGLAATINNLSGMSATGIIITESDITINSIASSDEGMSVTNGSFTFTVNVRKGTATPQNTSITGGSITTAVYETYTVAYGINEIINYVALADLTLDSDEHIQTLSQLVASEKLPTEVIVTDGKSFVQAQITGWSGNYNGSVPGNCTLTPVWAMPTGYVDAIQPIGVTISVGVNVAQTGSNA